MRNTVAVFKNQLNEFIADKEQSLMFIIFPVLTFFNARMTDLEYGMYPYQIVVAFAGMFAVAMMIMMIPQIIAEHREQGSLRFMVMSGIKPISYLLGIGGFFLIINAIAVMAFAWIGEISGSALINFLIIILLGVICSTLVGAIIGILSPNRQKAMGIAMPIGFLVMMLPMFVNFIEPIEPVLNVLYIGAIPNMLLEVKTGNFLTDFYIVLANVAVLTIIFMGLYKIKGLKA